MSFRPPSRNPGAGDWVEFVDSRLRGNDKVVFSGESPIPIHRDHEG